MTGVGATLFGRNGGGDRYVTDGELSIGVLAAKARDGAAPNTLENPVAIQIKQQLWSAVRSILQDDPGP